MPQNWVPSLSQWRPASICSTRMILQGKLDRVIPGVTSKLIKEKLIPNDNTEFRQQMASENEPLTK